MSSELEKSKEKKYKSKTQRKREWNPRAWAKKHLKDQGGMSTEQIHGMSSSEIDVYWQNAITCSKCVQEGKKFVKSKTGYLKLIISNKFPFISKQWFCSDCYETVGGTLLGYGDLGKVKPIKLSEKFPDKYCSECGRLKKRTKL